MTINTFGLPDSLISVFNDFVREYPDNTMRISRFLVDLTRRVRSRGLERTLCIDFPKLGKAVDKGLSTGEFIPCDVNIYQGVFVDRKDLGITPILELLFRNSNGKWHLRHPVDPTLVFYVRTFLYTFKKVAIAAPEDVAIKAISDFYVTDGEVSPVLLSPDGLKLLQIVSRYFIPLSIPTWDEINPRHGPGAVSDIRRDKDKFSFPSWSHELDRWFPRAEFAFHKFNCEAIGTSTQGSAARVTVVPKTLDSVRVITVEPASNQFLQQALRRWLLENQTAVASLCVDTSNQTLSQEAAREASIDGSSATVDLKSASDFLSKELVDLVFSHNPILLDMLNACRTRSVQGPNDDPVYLRKYAGQGNATTFIVQSLTYTILAVMAILFDERHALSKLRKRHVRKAALKVRVFGDDIIIPSQNMLTFRNILKNCGLRVNDTKTHDVGLFREACGGDFYHGYDVTPFYLKDMVRRKDPEGLASWVSVSNNAYKKGLLYTAFSMQVMDLPVNSPSGVGYLSRFNFRYSPSRRRWNKNLHRHEYREYVITTSKVVRETDVKYGRLYKYFVETPDPLVLWEGRLTVLTKVRKRLTWVA